MGGSEISIKCLRTLFLALMVSPALLFGCTTTQGATDRINREFVGQNVDSFFLSHGMPSQKHVLNSGDIMYGWSSQVHSYAMPATTTFQGNTAQTVGGGSLNTYCALQIVTSPEGTIKVIIVTADTFGDWTISRCAEIFKE
jgi:hypothetical protein